MTMTLPETTKTAELFISDFGDVYVVSKKTAKGWGRGIGYRVEEDLRRNRLDVLKMSDDGGEIVETYTVALKAGLPVACSCPDFRYRKRACKHQAICLKHQTKW